jgi:hypothetical protein
VPMNSVSHKLCGVRIKRRVVGDQNREKTLYLNVKVFGKQFIISEKRLLFFSFDRNHAPRMFGMAGWNIAG